MKRLYNYGIDMNRHTRDEVTRKDVTKRWHKIDEPEIRYWTNKIDDEYRTGANRELVAYIDYHTKKKYPNGRAIGIKPNPPFSCMGGAITKGEEESAIAKYDNIVDIEKAYITAHREAWKKKIGLRRELKGLDRVWNVFKVGFKIFMLAGTEGKDKEFDLLYGHNIVPYMEHLMEKAGVTYAEKRVSG